MGKILLGVFLTVFTISILSNKALYTVEAPEEWYEECTMDDYEVDTTAMINLGKELVSVYKYNHQLPFIARYIHCLYNEQLFAQEQGYTLIPSVGMVQIAKETNWGRSELSKINNNMVGIKYRKSSPLEVRTVGYNTIEYVNGKRVQKKCKFAAYNSKWESIRDRTYLLLNSRYYKKARKVKIKYRYPLRTSWKYLKGMKKWATDPHYIKSLYYMNKQYKLYKIDQLHPKEAAIVFTYIRGVAGYSEVYYDKKSNRLKLYQ